jgi:hypothetical protein
MATNIWEWVAAEERMQRRKQRRALVILLVSVAAAMGGLVYVLSEVAATQPPKVEIDLSKMPSPRPGPPR